MAKRNRYENDIYNGVLAVNKPQGMTSHDVVNKIRRLYSTKRVGHTGTLDPMATGVLVVLVGRAAKAAELIGCGRKKYIAGLKLGITTDTEDTTGEVLTESGSIPSRDEVLAAIEKFVGEIEQIPPMYSAVKQNGQKMVDLARKGIEVERKARPVTVYSIDVKSCDEADKYILEVECSGGTYIRTLCADIGKYLGCGGAMFSLERTRNAGFDISGSHTLEEIEKADEEKREALLLETERLFDSLPNVKLPDFYARLCSDGNEIYQSKIKTDYAAGEKIKLCDAEGFFAVGEVCDFEGGSAIKPIKQFRIKKQKESD